jgi:hypothetical protein
MSTFQVFPDRVVVMLVSGVIATSTAWAQQAPSTPGTTTPLTTGNAMPSPGGSTDPIESTLYAYKSLSQDATDLVNGISAKVTSMTVIIATPTDLNNLTMWQSAMVQATLLGKRLDEANSATLPTYTEPTPSAVKPPVRAGEMNYALGITLGSTLSNASNISTLVQTLASIFAVNQSVSPFTGSLTDGPLINCVTAELEKQGIPVLIPSVYTPSLFVQQSVTSSSPLIKQISSLEAGRQKLVNSLSNSDFQSSIGKANTVLSSKNSSDADKMKAQSFLQQAAQYVQGEMSVIQSVDMFESTLFSGQVPATSPAPTTPTPQTTSQGQQAGGPTPGQTPGQPSNPGTPGAPPPTQASPANGFSSLWPAPPSFAGGNGSIFPQLLSTDLLMQKLPAGCQTNPDDSTQCAFKVLVVKTLESGGSQVTKSNEFLGSKAGFSGGAVVTFGLYNVGGRPLCAGRASGWFGFKLTDDIQNSIPLLDQNGKLIPNNRASSDLDIGCAP